MDIQVAIKGAMKEDRLCQKHIYERFAGMLLSVSRRYNMASIDPRDIMQEAFIQIFRNLDKYDPNKGKFENWITTITIRVAIKISKKYTTFNTNIDDVFDLPYVNESVIDKMSADELLQVIDGIPQGYKEVFNLFVIDGYSHKEIGDMLGIKEVTSRSKLMRARDMISNKILRNDQKLKAI